MTGVLSPHEKLKDHVRVLVARDKARRAALDALEVEKARLAYAVAIWRARYRWAWLAIAVISAYASGLTLWEVFR